MRVARIHRRSRYGQAADADASSATTLTSSDVATGTATLEPSLEASSGGTAGLSLPQLWFVSVISGLSVWTITRVLDHYLKNRKTA